MNAAQSPMISYDILLGLADFLRSTGSSLAPAEAARLAIGEWMAAQPAHAVRPAHISSIARGYQWKCLFLPDGAELRMHYDGAFHYARVKDDAIIYEGSSVSPRQMTLAITGTGRNAWRDLWIRIPDELQWKPAALLRCQILARGAPKPVSPIDAMSAAATCMSDTLKSALALVEHIRTETVAIHERRVEHHRRAADILEDDCRLD